MGTIFVFGSNLAGKHGKGAALDAVKYWGAVYGDGEGLTGNAYALPTKDKEPKVRTLEDINQSYIQFWKYAIKHPELNFLVTPFGTGLAGYQKKEIWDIVQKSGMLQNLWFTGDWFNGTNLGVQ